MSSRSASSRSRRASVSSLTSPTLMATAGVVVVGGVLFVAIARLSWDACNILMGTFTEGLLLVDSFISSTTGSFKRGTLGSFSPGERGAFLGLCSLSDRDLLATPIRLISALLLVPVCCEVDPTLLKVELTSMTGSTDIRERSARVRSQGGVGLAIGTTGAVIAESLGGKRADRTLDLVAELLRMLMMVLALGASLSVLLGGGTTFTLGGGEVIGVTALSMGVMALAIAVGVMALTEGMVVMALIAAEGVMALIVAEGVMALIVAEGVMALRGGCRSRSTLPEHSWYC
jgi:hypothetical protein